MLDHRAFDGTARTAAVNVGAHTPNMITITQRRFGRPAVVVGNL